MEDQTVIAFTDDEPNDAFGEVSFETPPTAAAATAMTLSEPSQEPSISSNNLTKKGVAMRIYEVFENERYSPLSGFSAPSGVIVTDPKPVSVHDASVGWPSLQEANRQLLSLGWEWEPGSDWVIDITAPNVDAEGWTYAVDFADFVAADGDTGGNAGGYSGSASKGMMHFVRRRRRTRRQAFNAALICGEVVFQELTCDECDLNEVERLSNLFLDKLSAASIARHPRLNSIVKVLQLKSEFMAVLGLLTPSPDDVLPPAVAAAATAAARDNGPYSFGKLTNDLDALIGQSRSALLSRASSILSHNTADEALAVRTAEIARQYFTADERREVARLVIRVRDTEYRYHCNTAKCSSTGQCPFHVIMCENDGCGVLFSRNWFDQHDGICPEKLIECLRHCGAAPLKRRNMQHHLWHQCILRPVTCPFNEFGCDEELLEKDLEEHVNKNQSKHLHLALMRMKEYQSVIVSLNNRLHELETNSKMQASALSNLEASVQAGATALKLSEAKGEKITKDLLYRLEQKVSRNTSALGTTNGEVSRLQRQLAAMNSSK